MAFTVGKFGTSALLALSKLVLVTYLTEAFYVFVVLGIIAYFFGFNLIRFIKYIVMRFFSLSARLPPKAFCLSSCKKWSGSGPRVL